MQLSKTKHRVMADTITAIVWCTLPDGANEFHNQRWHDYTGMPEGAEAGLGLESLHISRRLSGSSTSVQSIGFWGAGEMEASLRLMGKIDGS